MPKSTKQTRARPKRTRRPRGRLATLTLSALGVVYGDIGTSPLYALKEVFGGAHHPVPINEQNVLGILSLVFWALMLVVSIKYVVFILRANNKGEGGIMALMALVLREEKDPSRARALMLLGLFGAALFYGDGLITPAISVLSAVEGLEVATPAFKPYVIPITLIVLVVLFAFQKRGTGSVGALFGPIMILWFVTLAALGVISIAPGAPGAGGPQPGARNRLSRGARRSRLLLPGRGGARGHRRGGAVRRHGALREQARPSRLVVPRPSGARAQLFRAGRIAPCGPEDHREPVLPAGSRRGRSTRWSRSRRSPRSSRRRR